MTRRPDPLAAARGMFVGACSGLALTLFVCAGAFAATGSETVGAWLMIVACVCSLFAIIAEAPNA